MLIYLQRVLRHEDSFSGCLWYHYITWVCLLHFQNHCSIFQSPMSTATFAASKLNIFVKSINNTFVTVLRLIGGIVFGCSTWRQKIYFVTAKSETLLSSLICTRPSTLPKGTTDWPMIDLVSQLRRHIRGHAVSGRQGPLHGRTSTISVVVRTRLTLFDIIETIN